MADDQFDSVPTCDNNDSEFQTPPVQQGGLQQDITTRRNRPKFLHEGALYVYHGMSSKKDAKYWRCEFFNARDIKCRGRLHTDLNDVVIRQIGDHVCNHSAARVEAQRILTGIKRRAMLSNERPLQIRTQTLQNTPMAVIAAMPSKEATKRMIKRARRGIDMNTLVNPHPCPIFKQDNGDQYMVYNEIGGQIVEGYERHPDNYALKTGDMEEKWARSAIFRDNLQSGGIPHQMGSSTTGQLGSSLGELNDYRQGGNIKGGVVRQRKKIKQEYLPPPLTAVLDRTLPHVFVDKKTNLFSFCCNIAGYSPEELQVELKGAQLLIVGTHKQHTLNQSFEANFCRRVTLPEGVHKDSIQCCVDDKGYLNINGQLMHFGGGKSKQIIQQQDLQQQHQQQQQTPVSSGCVVSEIDVV